MIQEWFDKNIFLYIILGICGLGILLKFIISMKYRLLIRASKRMGTSKNRLMRVLRLKFETCYKLKIGVNNVDTFVDKYVYRHRFCGILLYTWETISGEIIIVSVLSGSIFSILGLLQECEISDILSTLIAGVLGALVLISYDHFINLNTKRKVLKVNIRDYLENFLKSRLESGEFSSDLLEQYKKEYLELPNAKTDKKGRKSKDGKDIPNLVAQIESAATAVAIEKANIQKEQLHVVRAEDEFDDSQLFINHEENNKTPVEEETKDAKKKSKKKMKPEDEAELRREAKKNELKRMIQEDKVNRRKTMPEFFGDLPGETNNTVLELEKVNKVSNEIADEQTANHDQSENSRTVAQISPFSRPEDSKPESHKKEIAKKDKVKIEESKKEEIKKEEAKKEATKKENVKKEVLKKDMAKAEKHQKQLVAEESAESKKSISSEEAQIIEDILREYLA